MLFYRLFLFIAVNVLCHFVSMVSSHAYFLYLTPRNVYCINVTCTANGIGAQGPIWGLNTSSTLITASPISQTTCNGSTLAMPAPLGNSYDPGFQNTTAVLWQAGSS